MEAKQTFNAPEMKLHFLDYWRIIRIRKTVILAVFLLITITTTVVTFILPKSYASTVRMKVEKDSLDVAGLGQERQYLGFDPYWIQTEFEKIQSKTILYPVITNLGLNRKWAEKFKEPGELRTDITYAILKGHIDVRQARNTALIEIRGFSEDNDEAAVIANMIAEVYRTNRLEMRQDMSKGGIKVLEEEWRKQDGIVTNMQMQLNDLKTRLNISDIEAQQGFGYGAPSSVLEPETLRR